MKLTNQIQRLQHTVIDNGFCIGCGACAALKDSPFRMVLNDYGQYEAQFILGTDIDKEDSLVEAVCPFSSIANNETELAKSFYQNYCKFNKSVGYYLSSYAGYVNESNFRKKGSSGGLATWILNELLACKMVDYVVHVSQSNISERGYDNTLFSYTISSTSATTRAGAKSRYYPVELSEVLKLIRKQSGKYAIVGLPCFIKSIRLLQRSEPLYAERIKYCIGLVCGHLKSKHYAESLAWQAGIEPTNLENIDFRVKDENEPANKYKTKFESLKSESTLSTDDLFGTDWGAGAFKHKACDFCDDIFSETADIVIGDAWLPNYVQDSKGTNILVVRNPEIQKLIEICKEQKRLVLDNLPINKIIESQDGGLRHRRNELGYRLIIETKRGGWVPRKRVKPNFLTQFMSSNKRQNLRIKLRNLSHSSFQKAKHNNDINLYLDAMKPAYVEYKGIRDNSLKRIYNLSHRFMRRFISIISK